MASQLRTHMGHSHGHGHHHHHDTTYLTSGNKNDPGVRITRVGLYVNLGMAIVKGAGGYVFNSKALMADAVHALTDLVSDVTTLATISYSLRPATTRFPLGYGKIESVGALAVSTILLTGGVAIGLEGVITLSNQFFPSVADFLSDNLGFLRHDHSHGGDGHGHSHSHVPDAVAATVVGPSMQAAWLAAGSIIIKEWLYRATMKVAKEKRSSVLASNAYHHRVDSLTAFVALFTILASHVMEGARWLDPVGGLIISGMIVQAGWMNTKSAFMELADAGVDDEVREGVEKAAVAAVEGLGVDIRGVQGIKSGQNLLVEVEVRVPSEWTVARVNDLEAEIREKVATAVKGVKRVVIRFTSKEDETPFLDQFISGPEDKNGEHDHDHDHDHHHDHHDHHHTDGQTTSSARPLDTTQKRK